MRSHAKTFLLGALALACLASLLADRMNPYWLYIFYDIGIGIVMAVSLNLINGYTGQFSLGHAGFMAVGAYTAAVITNQIGELNFLAANGVFAVALLAGGLTAAVAGLLVGIPTLRLRGDYLAIVTLGFGEIIRVVLQNMDQVGAARGLSVSHGWTNLFWTFGLAAVTVYVVTSLVNSTYGRGFIAVHDDEVAAEAMGINTTKYKVTAFVVGAFFAGIAGGLYAHSKQFLTPGGFGFMLLQFLLVVVLSAILYASGEAGASMVLRFGRRLAGERGENSIILAGQAIRGVALGVGVTAIVQSVLGGIGLAVAGVPFAALLSALMLMLCIAQLGPGLILFPAVGWMFWTGETNWGIVLLAWSLLVVTLDNFLRPILIKKGADLPLLLIFAGVIGGMLGFGLIGIFVGPVALAVTYTLLEAWIADALGDAD